MSQLTIDELKKALPEQFTKSVNKELVNNINNVIADPEVYAIYRENLLSYNHVLQEGKFKLTNYLDAIRYCSYKFMGHTNISAYSKAFPDKIARFDKEGVAPKDVASYVSAYHKSKLVMLILEQAMIPTWLLNQDMFQKALNVQAELMLTAKSEKVRSDAANSVMTQLKQPETKKIELNVGKTEDKTIQALRETTMSLVAQQRAMLEAGTTDAQSVAHSKLITNVEYDKVDD